MRAEQFFFPIALELIHVTIKSWQICCKRSIIYLKLLDILDNIQMEFSKSKSCMTKQKLDSLFVFVTAFIADSK